MKKISKTKFDSQRTLRLVRSEKNILCETCNPFILKLQSSFQTERCFYFIMDFAAAGDLSKYLQIQGRFSEQTVRVLCAEILLGLEYLHQREIVYGDLKPENVLLDSEGHVLLADFGLSWRPKDLPNLQATDEFMAPEQILGQETNMTVDFWALVCLSGCACLSNVDRKNTVCFPRQNKNV